MARPSLRCRCSQKDILLGFFGIKDNISYTHWFTDNAKIAGAAMLFPIKGL